MTRTIVRAFFNNSVALQHYLRGDFPTAEQVAQNLFVEEWRQEYRHPDHFLKNRRDYVLGVPPEQGEGVSFAQILLRVITSIGKDNLCWVGNRLFVQEERFGEWQALLPSISPLLVMACQVCQEAGPLPAARRERRAYAEQWLVPNFRYSALPSPANPLVDGLIRREGLIEMHCHLNGATELDHIWLDAVAKPTPFYRKINEVYEKGNWKGKAVREQFQQIEAGLSPWSLYDRLCKARDVRNELWTALTEPPEVEQSERHGLPSILGRGFGSPPVWNSHSHPAEPDLWPADDYGELVLEAGYLIQLMSRLYSNAQGREDGSANEFAHGLYFCQLVCSQITALTVQQVEQFGFDQFQKITLNEMRDQSEKDYTRRFHQMNGPGAGDMTYLEGRFAPKPSRRETRDLLRRIYKGYQKFKDTDAPKPRTDLGLVCHFIKEPDQGRAGCRHHRLRTSLARMGRVLVATCDRWQGPFPSAPIHAPCSPHTLLRGIDAASNELQTPPEVFAPLFRYLRRRGAKNFTYHVGEDFVHLISGMRAIHEAVRFLGLRAGNRIGHGTAIGIEPKLWAERVGRTVVMAQGDYLDDLVFAHRRLIDEPGASELILRIEEQIETYSKAVYGRFYPSHILYRAWEQRNVDPLLVFQPDRVRFLLDSREREEEQRLLKEFEDQEEEVKELFCQYHGQRASLLEFDNSWSQLIEVETEIVPCNFLRRMQEKQLMEIVRLSIAIESLPTSNVRIGFYNDLSEHHIFRWLGVSVDDGTCPQVCLGSDDPGIFATSLRAEYHHLFCVLGTRFGLSPDDSIEILERLSRTANNFRFFQESDLSSA